MKRKPNGMIFLILTAVTLVVGGAVAFFQYSSVSDLTSKVEKLRRDHKDEKQLRKDLEGAELQLSETAVALEHLEKGVPEFAYVPTMLKELERVGKENGIQVLGVRPVPSQQKKDPKKKERKKAYTELDIEVSGRGSYRSVMNFVKALQRFPKIVAARTVSLTPKNDRNVVSGAPMLDVSITLRSYLFKPTEDELKEAPAEELGKPGVTAQAKEDQANG